MGPEDGRNNNEVLFFHLQDYISKIKLTDNTLFHLEETNRNFDDYFKKLSEVDKNAILYYWIDSLKKEIKYSNAIENNSNARYLAFDDDVFFETLNISHTRIKKLHQYITNSNVDSDYRKCDVRVSSIYEDGTEDVFWHGAKSEDVKKFMDDFIQVYKQDTLSSIFSSPFLKSALIHLLFVRIHPFNDGNGRTARMIHNIKFTQSLNHVYKSNLKVCPLNLSQSILVNKHTYVNILNSIYFDMQHNSNDEINKWFDFILNMVDEQIYYNNNKLPKLYDAFNNISKISESDDSYYANYARKMKLFK